jgi:hypothetical protein
MLGSLHVRKDQAASATKSSMQKRTLNGGKRIYLCRVDYLKYDNCYHPNVSARLRYYYMSRALNETGRPIFFSICNWGQEDVAIWGSTYGNSWRTTGDISDKWSKFIALLN